ncbi:unnamed protein product [Angiostrongylus costaricensis]|uniref:RanBP2-type domain-containing protein n=1 Tax=Angiostrongylus costaricensis TaxID=334426 RepID=A0A158PM22_ANGCS|nr:unnamed protein product [Angiostrongylus costaricensis]
MFATSSSNTATLPLSSSVPQIATSTLTTTVIKHTSKQESGDLHDEGDHDHVEEFEPQIDFKPVCPLPELVKIVTGEENEKSHRLGSLFALFCFHILKLYRYADETNEWKERGAGVIKVLENAENKKCRIVMRREQVFNLFDCLPLDFFEVHKVCANHQLLPGMTIQAMPRQEKAMMWYCEDFSEEQKSHEKLSARFASVEVANKFKEIFESAVKVPEECKKIATYITEGIRRSVQTTTWAVGLRRIRPLDAYLNLIAIHLAHVLLLFRWECPECYSRNAAEKCLCCGASRTTGKTGDAAPKYYTVIIDLTFLLLVFGSGFCGSKSFADHVKSGGSIFDAAHTKKAQEEFASQAKSKVISNKGNSADGEVERGADEEFEPNVDFAPAIPLPDLVDVVTGEEGEQVIFTARAKLYRFIKETEENKERGVGDLKILRNPKNNTHRVVMRRDHVHKVCANFAILPSIELNERKGVQPAYSWICRVASDIYYYQKLYYRLRRIPVTTFNCRIIPNLEKGWMKSSQ